MTEAEIMAELQAIVRDALGIETVVLTRQTTADDVPGWDSVRHVGIILRVEARFGITLLTREIDRLRNAGDFVDVILARQGAAPGRA